MSPNATAYMANPGNVRAAGSRGERLRPSDLRHVVPGTRDVTCSDDVTVLGGRSDPGAAQREPVERDGHEQQRHGQDQVCVPPSQGAG